MLKHRLIFGPLMIVLLAAVFYFDNQLDQVQLRGWWQTVFLGRSHLPAGLLILGLTWVLIPFAARELAHIFRTKGIPAGTVVIAFSGLIGCTMLYIMPARLDSQHVLALSFTVVILLFLAALVHHSFRRKLTQGALAAAGAAMLAMVYLGVLPGFLILIRRWHSAWIVLGVILAIKCCDIGAYFTGRAIGRHKLIPWLSPGKTWEGLFGGVAASMLAAIALGTLANHFGLAGHFATGRNFVAHPYPLWGLAVAGALFGLVGQFGDLVASLFKRDAGIKDSGAALPGFGGFLDVVDSPLGVAPLAYWLLELAAAAPGT